MFRDNRLLGERTQSRRSGRVGGVHPVSVDVRRLGPQTRELNPTAGMIRPWPVSTRRSR
jgi:hypothetical protein